MRNSILREGCVALRTYSSQALGMREETPVLSGEFVSPHPQSNQGNDMPYRRPYPDSIPSTRPLSPQNQLSSSRASGRGSMRISADREHEEPHLWTNVHGMAERVDGS